MQYIFLICEQYITCEDIGNFFTDKWNIYSSNNYLCINPITSEVEKRRYVQLEYCQEVERDFEEEEKAVFAELNSPKYHFVKYSDYKILREVVEIISQNIHCYIDNDHDTTLEGRKFMQKWSEEWSDDDSVAWDWIVEFELDENDPYCKIYIDTEMSKSELISYIKSLIKGKVFLRSITSEIVEIDVIQNDDFNSSKRLEEGGFVYYPFYLEIEPIKKKINRKYINEICNLLVNIKMKCRDAVAACDFEEWL
jgi:hypothetical protein